MKTLMFLFLLLLSSTAFGAQRGPIWIEPVLVESSNYEYIRSKNLVFGRKWDIQKSREYFFMHPGNANTGVDQGQKGQISPLTVQEAVWFPKVFGSPERIINIGQGDYAEYGFRFTNTHRTMVLSVLKGGGLIASTNNFVDLQISPNAFYAVGVFIQEEPTIRHVDKFRFILKIHNSAGEPRQLRWRFYYYRDGQDRPLVAGYVTIEMEEDSVIFFKPSLEMLSETVGREVTFGIFSSPFDPEITVP